MFLPPQALGCARLRPPLWWPATRLARADIPVLHTRDGYATPFYYYAAGCSDLHVRVRKMVVASNRVHAFKLTHKQRAPAILQERCGHELAAANLSAAWVVRRLSVKWPDPSIPPSVARFSLGGRGCSHHLNAVLCTTGSCTPTTTRSC